MKIKFVLMAFAMMSFSAMSAETNKVEVKWLEPEKYRDVRAANGGNKAFRERVFKNLEQHFAKMANEVLPQNVTLKVKVTDLDLAGDVRYNHSAFRDIRLVKRIYWPSIEFEYELLEQGKVIKSETVTLKDLSFMDRASKLRNRNSYYYEQRIITDWFIDDLKPMMAQLDKQKTAVMSS